ncbi:hypothetical protein RUND412_005398 [Rhizina undulata]
MASHYPPTTELMYRTSPHSAHNSHDLYRPPQHPMAGFQQPAPRQRTAIACRYCRRRKIRCSGFETSADGRCANCLRFNQECVFTPVSSQAQAFVPAHTAYPHYKNQMIAGRGRAAQPVLYGAHGQPLPQEYITQPSVDYPPPPPPPISHPYPRLPSPGTGSSGSPPYGRSYEEQVALQEAERNRRSQEQHAPVLPPPIPPGSTAQQYPPPPRRDSAGDYSSHLTRNDPPSPSSHLQSPHSAYSPPPVNGQPTSSFPAPSYGQGPSNAGSYYASQVSAVSPTGDRPSVSPHRFHPPMQYQVPPPPPPRPTSGESSQPGPSSHPIPSMQLSNLIDSNQSQQNPNRNLRSAADGDMLNRLMPRKGL